MSGRYDVNSGCAFFCADVLCLNCIIDVFAGLVRLVLQAAASKSSLTLSRGDRLSWGKALSGLRSCVSIRGVVGSCIATSFSVCALGRSGACDRVNTGGDLVTFRLVGAEEMIGASVLVEAIVVPRPVGRDTLKGAAKKLIQSP